jgi:GDP-D-mannose dehydratase
MSALITEVQKIAAQSEAQKGFSLHLPDWAIRDIVAKAQLLHTIEQIDELMAKYQSCDSEGFGEVVMEYFKAAKKEATQ